METLTAECTFITPAITSQEEHDRNGPLPRPPELRGQLRWAFRTVAASFLDGEELRRVETGFWGGRPLEEEGIRPSPVSVRLRKSVDTEDVEVGGRCARKRGRPIEVDENGRLRVTNRCYLCPALYLYHQPQPLVIRAGATFELELAGLRENALEVARRSLELLSLIGGYGRRFRRAFGCFEVRIGEDSTRVKGVDDFLGRLEGCLNGLRRIIAKDSSGASGPVESFPNFNRATLWVFEWRGHVGKLLDDLGRALKSARQGSLKRSKISDAGVELRWLLGSSPEEKDQKEKEKDQKEEDRGWLLRSPLLLSVTPVELRSVNVGRLVVSALLLKPKKLRFEKGRIIEVGEGDWKEVEDALDRVLERFRGLERYRIEVTANRVKVTQG
ncbi:MAG: RAMP superfamily CRISPR-associated protein [Euryarchaeota archaeon]